MHILRQRLTVFYWSIHCGLHHFAVTDSELGKNSTACRAFRWAHKIAKSDYQLRHVCPSVSMERLGSKSADIHEILYKYFSKIC